MPSVLIRRGTFGHQDRHRGKVTVLVEAAPFVVVCYSNPRRQIHGLIEEEATAQRG